jgi:hypothetical protein
MHLLILSDRFDKEVLHTWIGYQAATDGVDVMCHALSRVMLSALFDYHVTIVDLSCDSPNPFALEELLSDIQVALEQGRTIIFIAGGPPGSVQDTGIYGWLKSVNVYPQAAIGRNIQLTQHGRAQIFQDYFQNVNEYLAHWTATDETISEKTIAVVGDSELVIAAEYSIYKGKIVVLPPTSYDETVVHQVIPSLYNMARKYYEDMQKRIFVGDEPVWVEKHKTQEHLQIIDDIENLGLRKQEFDMITYLLYGTGPELEDSAKLTLERLGLEVEKTPPGANIDLTARNTDETIKLAIEVTGTVDKIKKGSRKVSQAWTYSLEKHDEQEKLVLMANTYNRLPIGGRSDKLHFTSDVENKFTSISALLMTTADLYFLWKDVHEKKRNLDEVLKLLYDSTGVLEIPSS